MCVCVCVLGAPLGHADFTAEVSAAAAVLDGAVVVVDGVAGAQAQTRTVWQQADDHKLPRVVFVNKLDREGASYARAIESLKAELGIQPLPLQVWCLRDGSVGIR